jgi:hypothetical protein
MVPSPGHRKLTVRLSEELRQAFLAACPPAERGRESGGAKVIHDFVAWYTHQPGAKMPRRPSVAAWKGRQAKGDHDAASE